MRTNLPALHLFRFLEFVGVLLLMGFFLCASNAQAKEIRIALRAHSGSSASMKKWQATANYLTEKLPGYNFVLVPYELNTALIQAVSRDEFDFILTNPAAYIELNSHYGAVAIATLVNLYKGRGYTSFGSVIFTRADRNDITRLDDLKGKKFMAVDDLGFGGWLIAKRELLAHQIDPYRDFAALSFAGGNQPSVVFSVQDGIVDAGSVRTDMLELMADHGEIELTKFKVLEPYPSDKSDLPHSTPLYPEWPFAKTHNTPEVLANKVSEALLTMTADSIAAKTGNYVGWTQPVDYSSVKQLLQELKAGPYRELASTASEQSPSDHFQRWQNFFAGVMYFIITVVILALLYFSRQLTETKLQLKKLQEQLEKIE